MEEIKRIPVNLVIKEFLITFEYQTKGKGYRREQQRTIRHFDKETAKQLFKEWAKTMRTMSNVQILGISEQENKEQIIAL